MDQNLLKIPANFSALSQETRHILSEISDELYRKRNLLPYDNLYTNSMSYASTTSEYFSLCYQLDKLMYNIGIKQNYYKEMYFLIENQTIENLFLDNKKFAEDVTIASTRIIVDPQFNSTSQIHNFRNTYQELRPINLHLQENNRHLVRVFKADNTLLVLTNKITWTMVFKIKALNCKLFEDQYCTYNKDVEKAYTALATNDLDEFNKRIHKILNYKTWAKYKRDKLAKCFQINKENRLAEKSRQIEHITTDITIVEQRYKSHLAKLQRLKEEYNTLLCSEETIDTNEILDYIECHRYIKEFDKYDTTVLELTIEAPIVYFDEDVIENYKAFPNAAMKFVMEEIFLKKKYKLWTRAKILLNTTNFDTTALRLDPRHDKYLPQPHLSRYGCQGNHVEQIRKWISNYDYIGCIEQIMVMACNLNWTDGIVIQEMFKTISKIKNCKTFEVVETGEFVSFNDILETREEE